MRTNVENFELDRLQDAASDACRLLRALAHPGRLLLLCQLAQGEHCVSELEDITGIHQPTLSQQLTVLREEGMVSTRREGKQIFYHVTSKEALAVLHVLYDQFCKKGKGARK